LGAKNRTEPDLQTLSPKAHNKRVTAEKRDLSLGQDHKFVVLVELDWKNWDEGGIVQGGSSVEISRVTAWEKYPKTTKDSIQAGQNWHCVCLSKSSTIHASNYYLF